jgi:hypothetical protein
MSLFAETPTETPADMPAEHAPTPQPIHPVAHLSSMVPRLHTAGTGPLLDPTLTVLQVVPWIDPLIDRLGHDPRGDYVERFWLSVLGPSTTWLVRSLSWGLASSPSGFALDLPETAKAIGISERMGRNSPFVRSITRCCQFDLAEVSGQHPSGRVILRVRTTLPWLSRRLVSTLPETLRSEHRAWIDASAQQLAEQRRSAPRPAYAG